VKRRSRYTRSLAASEENDVSRIPTLPPSPIWQYETAEYDAESSLPTLSLVAIEERKPHAASNEIVIDEIDTLYPADLHNHYGPIVYPQQPLQQEYLDSDAEQLDITELNTRPDAVLAKDEETRSLPLHEAHNTWITDIPTVPDAPTQSVHLPLSPAALPLMPPTRPLSELVQERLQPWTAGRGKNSPYAKRVAACNNADVKHVVSTLNWLDKLRWWLLCPGRMEFLLWFAGTLLLVALTCIFLFVSALSFGWMSLSHGDTTPAVSTTPITRPTSPTSLSITPTVTTTSPTKVASAGTGTSVSHAPITSRSVSNVPISVISLKEGTAPFGLHNESMWLVICGYLAAMVMLTLALILHRRYRQ
jgi:hypothetical protein